MRLTAELLKAALLRKGYAFGELNIIGIRSSLVVPDVFNDLISVVWKQPVLDESNLSTLQKRLNQFLYTGKDNLSLDVDGLKGPNTLFAIKNYHDTIGTLRVMSYSATTLPGVFYLNHPMNKLGCAVMVPGQYKSYKLGYHKPNHYALVQAGKIKVYRDKDLDRYAEEQGAIEEGYFGVNIHHSGMPYSNLIGKWSAGCQVFHQSSDLAKMLALLEYYKKDLYTYTLLRESEL